MAIKYQAGFNSGELSPKLYGRSDLDIYKNGCSRLENFFVLPQGGIERRPGTQYIDTTSNLTLDAWSDSTSYSVGNKVSSGGSDYICTVAHTVVAWADLLDYVVDDLVTYSGVSYICILAHTAAGTSPDADATNWAAYTVINDSDASQNFFAAYAIPTAGTEACRLIPFVFSSAENYAIEIGNGYARAWESDGTYTNISGTIPYAEADVSQIDYFQRFDILYLAHPDHPVQELKRTSNDPAFEINELTFDFPPLYDENEAGISLSTNGTTGSITLTASDDFFTSEMEGASFAIKHLRSSGDSWEGRLVGNGDTSEEVDVSGSYWGAGADIAFIGANSKLQTNVASAGWVDVGGASGSTWTYNSPSVAAANTLARIYNTGGNTNGFIVEDSQSSISGSSTTSFTSSVLNVSFNDWTISTGGTAWLGQVIIERKVGAAPWRELITIADTTNLDNKNFTYSSPIKEVANTFVRIKYIADNASSFTYNLRALNAYHIGLVKIDTYSSATSVTATVTSDLISEDATLVWNEGAFSEKNGYPRSITFHEDRMWLSGSDLEPTTIYGSVSGDYYNFLTGATDDLSIRRIPQTPEQTEWLIGKRYLFAGTEGGTMLISAVDRSELVTAANIKTELQSVFGTSSVSPVLANDVVVYAQKNGLKLREMVYNYEEENFVSNDLSILSDEILESGVKEMFIQKQPDQVIWCIKDDGEVSLLTYERSQEVVGWSRFITDGDVISGCALPSEDSEDEIWLVIKRTNTAGTTYAIEKSLKRTDMENYVDSQVSSDAGVLVSADSVSVSSSNLRITVSKTNHGLVNGDVVRLSNVTGWDFLEGLECTVSDVVTNVSFMLKTTEASPQYLQYTGIVSDFTIASADNAVCDGVYTLLSGDGTAVDGSVWENASSSQFIGQTSPSRFQFDDPSVGGPLPSRSCPDNGYPWLINWTLTPVGLSSATFTKTTPTLTLDYTKQVDKAFGGFTHLAGQTVQVVADGAYAGEFVVSAGGVITLEEYYAQAVAGLAYDSVMRTMPIEPELGNRMSQSRAKGVVRLIIKLYKSIDGKAGEYGKDLTTHPAYTTFDATDVAIEPKSGDFVLNIGSDWRRDKIIEVRQDLPYPMTVLSLAAWTEVEGG